MNRVAANVSSLIFGGDQSRLTSAATRHGSWSQCVRKREWGLSMNLNGECRTRALPFCGGARLLTSRLARTLAPPAGSWSQCAISKSWRLSMKRSCESGRGLPHSKTQARATWFRASARSWTPPVLWRFGCRCQNGFMAPMRVQSWRSKLSLNRNAAQVFQPAGSGDFPVAQSDCGQESPLNPQSGKTALQTGSRARIGDFS